MCDISIHAPAWGATYYDLRGGGFGNRFQSTLPRGERPVRGAGLVVQSVISIHAPAWGAT